MKILDKYLLKTFLTTFTTVFVILFFVFVLQTVWLFIAELAGKGLDLVMVLKFLAFAMPRIVPLVLPLSVLLASIMTFGDLSENYELAAMKSAGVSLKRALKGLTIFILLLSIVAFFFANNVIPYAEFKFINFRKNIAQSKPALAIAEGQFSDVGYYTIKVDKKSGENGNTLTGITIHKKSNTGEGGKTVIRAKDGLLISSDKSSVLQLVLNNGYYFEDIIPTKYEDRAKIPFAKSSFKKYVINLDLSKLNKINTDDQSVSNTNTMLTLNELKYTLDSLNKNLKTDVLAFSENMNQRIGIPKDLEEKAKNSKENTVKTTVVKNNVLKNNLVKVKNTVIKIKKIPRDILSLYKKDEQLKFIEIAINNLISTKYSIDSSDADFKNKQKNINNHVLAFYDKFVIVYACFLMFFIGAPLGAIIRKGGLGLPIIFAVLIFISFHFINTFGKRISQEDGLDPFLGAWMSSLILTPLAVLLTYKATNDSSLINLDWVIVPIQKVIKKISTKK